MDFYTRQIRCVFNPDGSVRGADIVKGFLVNGVEYELAPEPITTDGLSGSLQAVLGEQTAAYILQIETLNARVKELENMMLKVGNVSSQAKKG